MALIKLVNSCFAESEVGETRMSLVTGIVVSSVFVSTSQQAGQGISLHFIEAGG